MTETKNLKTILPCNVLRNWLQSSDLSGPEELEVPSLHLSSVHNFPVYIRDVAQMTYGL